MGPMVLLALLLPTPRMRGAVFPVLRCNRRLKAALLPLERGFVAALAGLVVVEHVVVTARSAAPARISPVMMLPTFSVAFSVAFSVVVVVLVRHSDGVRSPFQRMLLVMVVVVFFTIVGTTVVRFRRFTSVVPFCRFTIVPLCGFDTRGTTIGRSAVARFLRLEPRDNTHAYDYDDQYYVNDHQWRGLVAALAVGIDILVLRRRCP